MVGTNSGHAYFRVLILRLKHISLQNPRDLLMNSPSCQTWVIKPQPCAFSGQPCCSKNYVTSRSRFLEFRLIWVDFYTILYVMFLPLSFRKEEKYHPKHLDYSPWKIRMRLWHLGRIRWWSSTLSVSIQHTRLVRRDHIPPRVTGDLFGDLFLHGVSPLGRMKDVTFT